MYKDMVPADLVHESRQNTPVGIAKPVDHSTLERQVFEQQERYIRLLADFDNFKKRVAREIDQRASSAKEALVQDLLPVIDNLDRALANTTAEGAIDPLRAGVEMTFKQFVTILRKHGFEPREDLGKQFDPNHHEAVCTRTDARHEHHAVLEVWQRAWMRGSTLFRPAKVVVNDLQPEAERDGVAA